MQARAMEMDAAAISRRLRACQARGVTYKQIEMETGVSRTGISQLANHGMAMHAEKLTRLAAWLDVNAPKTASEAPTDESGADGASADQGSTAQRPGATFCTNVDIYPTEDFKKLIGWLNTVYKHRAIGALVGHPGSGKTTVLKEYAKLNPNARYVKCWALMRMGDLLTMIGRAAGIHLTGSLFSRQQKLIEELRGSSLMLLLDEAEFLRSMNVKKLEVLREIWDEIGIPIVFCGTNELEHVLTRGTGRENCAQLYRRGWQNRTCGLGEQEAARIFGSYRLTTDATQNLAKMATDHAHGGMGNAFEVLKIALEAAEGSEIDARMIRDAAQCKVLFR